MHWWHLQGVTYGILTSCLRSFFVKRTGEDSYEVSPRVVWGYVGTQDITAKEATFGE